MEELLLISKYPGSLRPLVERALAAALRSIDFSEVCSEDFRPHYKPQ